MSLGRVGVWTFALDGQPPSRSQEIASELEELGYGAIWVPETLGREAFTNSSMLLAGTRTITIATGIANIWFRTAQSASNAHRTVTSVYPDRFVLGLGVSHGVLVEGVLREQYVRPLTRMRGYLEAMDATPFMAAAPSSDPKRVLAALGPKMLSLAASNAAGAHPYFVPVEHTSFARGVLGDGPMLAPEQAVVLETDPAKAREIARGHMAGYLRLPNYTNNLRRLGFTEGDLSGPTDHLVDAIVAWGSADQIAARVKAHHDAGADHVCIQVLDPDLRAAPLAQWRELAPALLA